jgi:hypothetical protein
VFNSNAPQETSIAGFTTHSSTALLLLFLWQMVEKLSHHCSGIPVQFDGILEHLLHGIEFKAIQQMFLVHGGVWHLANWALTRFICANFS